MSMPGPRTSRPAEIVLDDERATAALAARIADIARQGDLIALAGGLGAGKTAFARAFVNRRLARAGRPAEEVPSPTFTLVQVYEAGEVAIWHVDLYRIEDADELTELGLEEGLADGILLVEWPDRLGAWPIGERLEIELVPGDGTRRLAQIDAGGDWGRRLADAGIVR